MTDIFFYHLMSSPLETVLPDLLEKSLAKGWNACIQAISEDRVEWLNMQLWTFRDDSFLPHGSKVDGEGENQPIWLTTQPDNPNGSAIRFLIDGAAIEEVEEYQRVVYLFNGQDATDRNIARSRWKNEKAAGRRITYWAQNSFGTWEKKA